MNNVKEDLRKKTDLNFNFSQATQGLWGFNKKEYYIVHIIELILDQKRLKYVGNCLIQYLRGQLSHKKCPISFNLCSTPFTFPQYDDLNPLTLCPSKSHKYNNYDHAAYIVSS